AQDDQPIPETLPRNLLPEYERWGQGLLEDEVIEIETPSDKQPVRVTSQSRTRLAALADTPYEAEADVIGEILEADVRQRRSQIWVDGNTAVSVAFPAELEDEVTRALREHRTTRVH